MPNEDPEPYNTGTVPVPVTCAVVRLHITALKDFLWSRKLTNWLLRNIVTAVTDLDLICWSDPYPKKKKSSKVLKFKLNCTILKLLCIISGPVLDPQYRRNYCKFFVQYRHIPGDFLCIFKGLYLFAEVFSLMVSISRRFFVRKRLEVLIRIQLKISILVQTIYFLFL